MLTEAGRKYLLNVLRGTQAPEDYTFGLYTNTPTWSDATVFGDLTEPTETGYAPQPVPASTLGVPSYAGGDAKSDADLVTITNGDVTAIVANGFYVKGATSGVFLGGDDFAAPVTISASDSRDFRVSFLSGLIS